MNKNYYLTEKNKLIYKLNRVGKKSSIISRILFVNKIDYNFFATIKTLFNYIKNLFGNFY